MSKPEVNFSHQQVETYEVPGKIEIWDNELLSEPEKAIALLTKDPNWKLNTGDFLNENTLDAIYNHNRTVGTFSNLLIEKGFYYIDGKGTSNFLSDPETLKTLKLENWDRYISPPIVSRKNVWGLQDLESAMADHKAQKKFKSLGIRTHESIGIIKLEYIYYKNQKIKVSDITPPNKKTLDGLEFQLPPGYVPVQQIRAFATPYRIEDILGDENIVPKKKERSKKEKMEEAMQIVSNELGKDLSHEEYLSWFFQTIGKNLGLMHSNGYKHGYLHHGNITLDARFTDFDSVSSFSEIKKELNNDGYPDEKELVVTIKNRIFKDYQRTGSSIYSFQREFLYTFFPNLNPTELQNIKEKLFKEFKDSYDFYSQKIMWAESPNTFNDENFDIEKIKTLANTTKI